MNENFQTIQRVQNKSLRRKQRTDPCGPLCRDMKLLELKKSTVLNNCLFEFDYLYRSLLDVLW